MEFLSQFKLIIKRIHKIYQVIITVHPMIVTKLNIINIIQQLHKIKKKRKITYMQLHQHSKYLFYLKNKKINKK